MSTVSVLPAPAAPHKLANVAFERPPEAQVKPFEALLPIMSRLPATPGETESEEQVNSSQGYIVPQPELTVSGTLPYSPSHNGVTYTVARLPQVDAAAIDLWTALHGFRPLTTDYAGDFQGPTRARAQNQCPFASSTPRVTQSALDLVRRVFNWSAIRLPAETSASFYGVVFRSKRANGSESTNLYTADRLAHEEAVAAGGLLMYFYGAPDAVTGSNLATCIWTSREAAIAASALPLHAKATAHARKAYESFELSRYRVVKIAGETGLRIEAW